MAQKTARAKGAKAKKAGRAASERYQKALEVLEKAVKALYKGDPGKAKEYLEKLQEGYAEEKELMDRVRTYLLMCERQLSPQRRPKTAEEMVNAGVMSLNEGDPGQAIKHLTKALELEPKSAHVQYCLAAAYAVSGDASTTAKHLKQAITADPASRIHARTDEDFKSVREASEVSALLAEA
jgi:tetratricopeptide (TPR) repeat protein